MRRYSTVFCLLTTTAAGALLAPASALAQEDDSSAANESRGNTIVVTARKREENLIDVPLPVTVAGEEQLERDQVFTLTDLQRITPALEVSQTSGGESNGGARLRGLGTGVFNPSVSPSVALVVDQVPVGNLAFPQLFDLAQVEVLRGPQGTLFGQGASAGVVNISTRRPQLGVLGANASIDFADKGTAGSEVSEAIVNGGFNLPLGDVAAIRVAGQYKNESGLQRNVTNGQDNEIENFGVRVRGLLEATPFVTVNLNAEYAEQTSDGNTFFAIAVEPNSTQYPGFGPPFFTLGGLSTDAFKNCGVTISPRAEEYCSSIDGYVKLDIFASSAIVDWEVSDRLSFTSITAYRSRSNTTEGVDFSRITGTFAARFENVVEESNQFTQELRATVTTDAFDLVVGGYYNDFHFETLPLVNTGFNDISDGNRIGFSLCNLDNDSCIPLGGMPPAFTFVEFTREETDNRTLAAFADATFKLSDQFSIFGGLRFTDYQNTTRTGSNTLLTPNTFSLDDTNLSGRVGVSYQPNPDTNIYASFARGYKPPAVGTNPAGVLFVLEPEESDAFELGTRFALGGFQLGANAFYTEVRNFQAQASTFVGTSLVSQPLNVESVESYGFELTAYGELFTGFSVNAGYQFNHITFPEGYLGDAGGDLGGTQFLNAPKHKFSLSGEYSLPVSNNVEVFANANVVYKSEVLLATRADPRYRYPAHEIVNGGLGVRDIDGAWSAAIFVRNLTKEREPTALLASTFAGQLDGGIRAWPVAGLTARVVGVRVGFEF